MRDRRAPLRRAVALEYDPAETGAPVVKATGKGTIAEHILALARKNGVPIREDRELMELLARLDLGDEIPPALYTVVAELLAYVYRVNARIGRARATTGS